MESNNWQDRLSPKLHDLYNWIYGSQESPKTQREIAAFTVHWEVLLKELISKELDKAREEGRQEVGIRVNHALSEMMVGIAESLNSVRQEECQRILKLIEEMRKCECSENDDECGFKQYNQALEALKEKLKYGIKQPYKY